MEIIQSIKRMQEYSEAMRLSGRKIALVPTMGYFHEGHLNLMRLGKKKSECLVVSIYVNPTQFAPTEDFEAYPRDFERDLAMAREVGVDVVFCPDNGEMYPGGYQTYVQVEDVTKNLCGISRPLFFRGVTTVCTKLFNTVKPHISIFGQKDFQQYITIKRMVQDLNLDMDVLGMATTRETDGLAMSSRNVYLKPDERKAALSLSRSLVLAEGLYSGGQRETAPILEAVRNYIASFSGTRIDYVQICDTTAMADVAWIESESVLALAVWVGKTRLIDNHVFGETLLISDAGTARSMRQGG